MRRVELPRGGGCGVLPLLARRVGARWVRATAGACGVERSERKGSAACRGTWGCRGQEDSGGSAVVAAGVVA